MRIDLTGKRALVLGASGGLGGAIAAGLVAAGARVAVSGRSAEKLAASFPGIAATSRLVSDLASPGVGRSVWPAAGWVASLSARVCAAMCRLPRSCRSEQTAQPPPRFLA